MGGYGICLPLMSFWGAGGIVALSPLLIRILADEPYYPAWRYIPMLTLSMAAAALSNFMGSVYVVTKKSAASFWTSLVGATANVLLNLLLPFPLSGKKLALGVGALTVQTGWLLLGLPGGLLVQGGCLVLLLLLGAPAVLSTAQMIFHRK